MKTYKRFKFDGQLTAEQYLFFQKNGFIHFENFASQEVVKDILDSLEPIQEDWVSKNVQTINGIPIKYGKDVDGKSIVHRYAFTSQFSKPVETFAKSERLEKC